VRACLHVACASHKFRPCCCGCPAPAITTVTLIIGTVVYVKPTEVPRVPFTRDLVFLAAALLLILVSASIGTVSVSEGSREGGSDVVLARRLGRGRGGVVRACGRSKRCVLFRGMGQRLGVGTALRCGELTVAYPLSAAFNP